ncbi:CRISPR-associated Csy2 family protein [Sphaerotilus hippei]|uniref:CRISPR-associated Csy2 family protein n=1 Tax=Sphaerotilus hippei TaxID=744406 RepID=A0A318GWN3_9BURK|nr:type I-F CRISPR-associated protein Csy2 [Sphaerotilus hippei]PXW94113.1 CRISPR-associated Csy2 family protein [Sphaerotilus hippei]
MPTELPTITGVLVIPRLRIQNANAISSPLTWGAPAMSALLGTMHSLERRLGAELGLNFNGVGVICHGHEAQTTEGGFTRAFRLSRNPVNADGSSASIVEEGRIHLDISLVFGVVGTVLGEDDATRQRVAQTVADHLAGMRVAGGSVMPALPHSAGGPTARQQRPQLLPLGPEGAEQTKAFRSWRLRWLPGFALVSRDDLLHNHHAKLQAAQPGASLLDAWLDLSRLNYRAQRTQVENPRTGELVEAVTWQHDRPAGWIVPIPVGYAALSPLYEPGEVAGARDRSTHFRFVESVYSLGQWISPHRLTSVQDLLWYGDHDEPTGLYRCRNDYRAPAPADAEPGDPACAPMLPVFLPPAAQAQQPSLF